MLPSNKILGDATQWLTADGYFLGIGVHNLYYIRGNQREVVGPYHCEVSLRGFSGPEQWHTPKDCYYKKSNAISVSKERL